MSAPNETDMMEVEEEVIDELRVSFEDLEESLSEMTAETAATTCQKYQDVLSNERSDEVATKIKEKCIYRYVLSYYDTTQYDIFLFVESHL